MVEPSMTFPFSALVGQAELKLCLVLAAIDWRLSCLIRGDKGSGKSTAARGLAEILPGDPPFVNVPIGVTEDRLLGGLSLDDAFQGNATLKPGLVHAAHNGVLYIDEVNLLAGHLTDALLDVSATGKYVFERDGFSQTRDSQFVLMGSMNLEEGALRPQLLDRFALAVDVQAPMTPVERVAILQTRLRFDDDPQGFRKAANAEQIRLTEAIAAARDELHRVTMDDSLMTAIAERITAVGVRSLRADLAAIRGCAALAAFEQRDRVTENDMNRVLPLVLLHRANKAHGAQQPPPAQRGDPPAESNGEKLAGVRVFTPEPRSAPRLRPVLSSGAAGKPTPKGTPDRNRVDIFASLQSSARNSGVPLLQSGFLVHPKSQPHANTRYVFVVDCSGSQAAKQRMRAVKGIALALINRSFSGGEEVAVIIFRGPHAEVLVEPSKDVALIERQLEIVPTGGRTPLAHALELASHYINENACLILLTDGRANVPLRNGDPWEEAIAVAKRIQCPSLVIDTSTEGSPRMTALSQALRANQCRLDDLEEVDILNIVNQ